MSNKIETHPKRAEIEARILKGESYQSISNWCVNELGFDISHMSIKRFADKTGLSKNRDNNIQEGLSESEIEEIVNEVSNIDIEVPSFDNEADFMKYSREILVEIYLKQLAIVKTKQLAFVQGNGKFPQNEINGLKTIISCVVQAGLIKPSAWGEGGSGGESVEKGLKKEDVEVIRGALMPDVMHEK